MSYTNSNSTTQMRAINGFLTMADVLDIKKSIMSDGVSRTLRVDEATPMEVAVAAPNECPLVFDLTEDEEDESSRAPTPKRARRTSILRESVDDESTEAFAVVSQLSQMQRIKQEQEQEQAQADEEEEEEQVEDARFANDRRVHRLVLGGIEYEIDEHCMSYPVKFSEHDNIEDEIERVFVCERCLGYNDVGVQGHACEMEKAENMPGNLLWKKLRIEVHEIGGKSQRIFCQNLSFLAKLFIENKAEYEKTQNYVYYVVSIIDELYKKRELVGYFSRNRDPDCTNTLSCIMTFPKFRQQGYGDFMIALAYSLVRRERRKAGSPEEPNKQATNMFMRFWQRTIREHLPSFQCGVTPMLDNDTLERFASITGIAAKDLKAAASSPLLKVKERDNQSLLPNLTGPYDMDEYVRSGFEITTYSMIRDSAEDVRGAATRVFVLHGQLLPPPVQQSQSAAGVSIGNRAVRVRGTRARRGVKRMNIQSFSDADVVSDLMVTGKPSNADVLNYNRAKDQPLTRAFSTRAKPAALAKAVAKGSGGKSASKNFKRLISYSGKAPRNADVSRAMEGGKAPRNATVSRAAAGGKAPRSAQVIRAAAGGKAPRSVVQELQAAKKKSEEEPDNNDKSESGDTYTDALQREFNLLVEEGELVVNTEPAPAKKKKAVVKKRKVADDSSSSEAGANEENDPDDSDFELDDDAVADEIVEVSCAPVGLSNLGNSCYMNAVLQCLAGVPSFSTNLLSGATSHKHDDADGCLVCISCETFKEMYRAHTIAQPNDFHRLVLPELSEDFMNSRKCDAHDFFFEFANLFINEELPADVNSMTATADELLRTRTFRTFGVGQSDNLHCLSCKHTFDTTFASNLGLSLPMHNRRQGEPVQTIEELIDAYLTDEGVSLKCEKCSPDEDTVMQKLNKRFSVLPQTLVLHLKRFTNAQKKIASHVEFEETLRVACGTDEEEKDDAEYALRGVVVHRGGPGLVSCTSHFYAFVRYGTNTWLKYDDNKVTEVSFSEVQTSNAYMLFYDSQDNFDEHNQTLARFVSKLRGGDEHAKSSRGKRKKGSTSASASPPAETEKTFGEHLQLNAFPAGAEKVYHDMLQVMTIGAQKFITRATWMDIKRKEITKPLKTAQVQVPILDHVPVPVVENNSIVGFELPKTTDLPKFTLEPEVLREARAEMAHKDECIFDFSQYTAALYDLMKAVISQSTELHPMYDGRVPLCGVGDPFLSHPSAFHCAAARQLRYAMSDLGHQLVSAGLSARDKPYSLQSFARITIRPEGNSNNKGKLKGREVRPEHAHWDEYRMLWNGDKYAIPIAFDHLGQADGLTTKDVHFELPSGHMYVYNTREKVLISPSSQKAWREKKEEKKRGTGSIILSANRIEWSFFVARFDNESIARTMPPPGYDDKTEFVNSVLMAQDVPLMYDVQGDTRTVEKHNNKLRPAFRRPEIMARKWGEKDVVTEANKWCSIVMPTFEYGKTTKTEVRRPYLRHCFNPQFVEYTEDRNRTCADEPRSNFAVLPSLKMQSNLVLDYGKKGKITTIEFMHLPYSKDQIEELTAWKKH